MGRLFMTVRARFVFIFLVAISMLALPALADRTTLKQGWNLFSVQQDVEMGREFSQEAESMMDLVRDSYAIGYIQALGGQLVMHAPGYKYPYQFKIVNDKQIEAFALPGGFIYVTRGLIENAQTEPQLAGILAHQIGHVVMRHGTQQVSKGYSEEHPNANRARVTVGNVMSALDLTFDPDSIALKFSPEAERQADLVATQILYDAGFDPRQMTQAFQKLEGQTASLTADFFSSHPRVTNRAARVRREVQNMGGLRSNLRGDSPDLHKAQDRLRAEGSGSVIDTDRGSLDQPDLPSTRTVSYTGRDLSFRYPSNWRVSEQSGVITVAPSEGTISGDLAYGMRIATFEPRDGSYFGQNSLNVPQNRANTTNLSRATDELLDDLKRSNPNMRVVGSEERGRVDGEPSMTIELVNDSPAGGRETDWLVAVLRPDGVLYYFVGVAPEKEFSRYESAFEQLISSVRFND
jgi:beta-barrel assembly-enhancing protease